MDKRELLASRMFDDEQSILPCPHNWDDPREEPYREHYLKCADWIIEHENDPNIKEQLAKALSDDWAYEAISLLDMAVKAVTNG